MVIKSKFAKGGLIFLGGDEMAKVYKIIDVSVWQGDINWKRVKEDGIVGAIIRYADGDYLDSKFKQNMKSAKKAGLHIGAYIFSRAKTAAEGKKEAERIIKACKSYKCDLPIYIDLEVESNASVANEVASAFLSVCNKKGIRGGIYANLNWFRNYISVSKFKKYPLWIAQYNDEITYKDPSVFGMWQYSSKGKVAGISGYVDMNKCYETYWNESAPKKKEAKKKTIDGIAKEVIAGKWGNGAIRRVKLTSAGYSYSKVQTKVNELMKKKGK